MKTLAAVLALLLVVPAGAQQIPRTAPNFYVPYAVELAWANAVRGESSSSDDARFADAPSLPSAPQVQRRPVRSGYPRFGPAYGPYMPSPAISPRTDAIVGAVVIAVVLIALFGGNH